MIESAMPSRAQRVLAFGGFCLYLLTAMQVEEHKVARKRAELLAPIPMPGPAEEEVTGAWLLPEWDIQEHHQSGGLHLATPHLHAAPLGAPLASWPHTHDG